MLCNWLATYIATMHGHAHTCDLYDPINSRYTVTCFLTSVVSNVVVSSPHSYHAHK